MRYAVFSDVHANLEAFSAVVKALEKEKAEGLIYLGDIVGYGPEPAGCIDTLRKLTDIIVAGNHDRGAVGMTDIRGFNPYARAAIEWTGAVLSDEHREFLKNLPLTQSIEENSTFLMHGTPGDPESWYYLHNKFDAAENFSHFKEMICLVGHSHIPAIFEINSEGMINLYYDSVEIKKGFRYIINVGSVGQPRDGNPDAAYAILTDDSLTIKRVSYDIVVTQKKMREAGLPESLIKRLSVGL